MKFFGWGRKKDPPPLHPSEQEIFQKPDIAARSSSHSAEEVNWRGDLVTEAKGTRPSDGELELLEPGADDVGNAEAWEDRLQETIRFVFSHEHEGLLAIGTFALDQLAGARDSLDGRPKHPAPDPITSSRRNSVSSVQLVVRELGSSDDETNSHREPTLRSPVRSSPASASTVGRKELPVFGDHDAFSGGHASPIVLARHTARDPPHSHTAPVGEKQMIDRSNEEFSSAGVCGLWASRRGTKLHKEKRKKGAENRECEYFQGTDSSGGVRRGFGRLWRSGCNSSFAPAKVAPDKREASLLKDPPCIGSRGEGGAGTGTGTLVVPPLCQPMLQCPPKPWPKQAAENGHERRKRGHSFEKGWACAQNGNWIRTDSEFVVLEM